MNTKMRVLRHNSGSYKSTVSKGRQQHSLMLFYFYINQTTFIAIQHFQKIQGFCIKPFEVIILSQTALYISQISQSYSRIYNTAEENDGCLHISKINNNKKLTSIEKVFHSYLFQKKTGKKLFLSVIAIIFSTRLNRTESTYLCYKRKKSKYRE